MHASLKKCKNIYMLSFLIFATLLTSCSNVEQKYYRNIDADDLEKITLQLSRTQRINSVSTINAKNNTVFSQSNDFENGFVDIGYRTYKNKSTFNLDTTRYSNSEGITKVTLTNATYENNIKNEERTTQMDSIEETSESFQNRFNIDNAFVKNILNGFKSGKILYAMKSWFYEGKILLDTKIKVNNDYVISIMTYEKNLLIESIDEISIIIKSIRGKTIGNLSIDGKCNGDKAQTEASFAILF